MKEKTIMSSPDLNDPQMTSRALKAASAGGATGPGALCVHLHLSSPIPSSLLHLHYQ